MSLVGKLIGFGFRQVIGAEAGNEVGEIAGNVAGPVIHLVQKHFTDHSQNLLKALARANDRAWQALSIALAGDTFLDKIKVFFASGDDKGIREQVRLFLQDKNIGFEGTPADLRQRCLTELNLAKKAGLLSAQNLSSQDVARQTANFRRYADPKAMVDGAEQTVQQIAADLDAEYPKEYPNLAKLLRQRPVGGPPLLIAAFAYFFRREVETDEKLAHGLFFDGLRQLSASQEKAFLEINEALISMGDQYEQIIRLLVGIETAVLDMQVELQRLEGLHLANADEVRRLIQEVLNRVSQIGMQKGEVKPQHSFSIRSEDERTAVRQLLTRFRQLPAEQQRQVPALLNGLGKLQFGSQDFDGARQTFVAVAEKVHDTAAQAEAQFNAYRAALEEKKWADALAAIQQAATLDTQRFAPFPLQRYQPKKILGAGGFGTAFLCLDRFFNAEVVVKTLHDAALERNMNDVFREAQVLGQLHHPVIIGVRDCNYADMTKMARPYIVMDYFPGVSLQTFVQERGTIPPEAMIYVARQIAQGMQAAHQSSILHRDLKPDNVLIRKEGDQWKVKIIDFGLALRKQTIETSMAARSAGNTILSDSVAGTVKYAPPEQMGELKGVKPGTYSDVYSFGKMCCYALFKTTEPRRRQWSEIAEELAGMLEQCTEQELEHRLSTFEPVLKVLESLESTSVGDEEEEQDDDPNSKKHGRKEPTMKVLQSHGLLSEGTEIEVMPDARPKDTSIHDPRIFRAHIGTIGTKKSAIWEYDGKAYSLTDLSKKLERYGLVWVRPKTFQLWRIAKQTESMWAQAEPLRAKPLDSRKLEAIRQSEKELQPINEKNAVTEQCPSVEAPSQAERERVQQEGESKLVRFVREAMDRTQGKPTHDDSAAAREIVKQHRISSERVKQIVEEVREQWQKAHTPKAERKPGEIVTNSLGMKFAWIPPGTFLMGSPSHERVGMETHGYSENQHEVTLTKDFYMGVHPVTRGQFAEFVQKSGFKPQAELEGGACIWAGKDWKMDLAANWSNPGFEQTNDHPVTCVSWSDAVAFANWLAEQEKKPYRLPTEAEWEYACRAGTTSPFCFGETISTDQANYNGNYTYGCGKKGVFRQKTTPVGNFPANAWGISDAHGNVWEWCQDHLGTYPEHDVVDPQGRGDWGVRMVRGGSWFNKPGLCRSACRWEVVPGSRNSRIGFRLCFRLD